MSKNSKVLTPPGELIDLKGRKVHIQRSGSGSPTVVFESGIISDSFAFHRVQPEIAQITSTISYDRAGHGYSDPSPTLERVESFVCIAGICLKKESASSTVILRISAIVLPL